MSPHPKPSAAPAPPPRRAANDAERIAYAGEILHGPRWVAPLARAIDVDVKWLMELRDAVRERRSFEVQPFVVMKVRAHAIAQRSRVAEAAALFI